MIVRKIILGKYQYYLKGELLSNFEWVGLRDHATNFSAHQAKLYIDLLKNKYPKDTFDYTHNKN